MATNKNATIRYQVLDRCFRNPGRRYYIQDLIEACNEALLDINPQSTGIKRRQIYEDIKFMQDSKGFDAKQLKKKLVDTHKESKTIQTELDKSSSNLQDIGKDNEANKTEIKRLRDLMWYDKLFGYK